MRVARAQERGFVGGGGEPAACAFVEDDDCLEAEAVRYCGDLHGVVALDGALGNEGWWGPIGTGVRGADVGDEVFELAVFVACAGEWRGVVFSFGVEGDRGCFGCVGAVVVVVVVEVCGEKSEGVDWGGMRI